MLLLNPFQTPICWPASLSALTLAETGTPQPKACGLLSSGTSCSYTMNFSAAGAAELLSARAMALMLCLSDYEATGFLDEAAGRLATCDLLDQCADLVLNHAGEHIIAYPADDLWSVLAVQLQPPEQAMPIEATAKVSSDVFKYI